MTVPLIFLNEWILEFYDNRAVLWTWERMLLKTREYSQNYFAPSRN